MAASNLLQRLRPVARVLVAAEWTNEGMYKKVLGGDPRHEEIVASLPLLSRQQARGLLQTLGLVETGIALWVLSGRFPKHAAILETGLVTVMNAGGLLFAGEHIPDHGRLIARSTAFLALVWIAAIPTPEISAPQ
jgi:uncharacterized membrane protein YphA (DoxX/SURF4 family)